MPHHTDEHGIVQTLQVLTLGLPGFEPPSTRQSLIDVDADGYLEATQWVQANQALLAIGVVAIAVNDACYLRAA